MKKLISLALMLCITLTVCSAGFMTITASAAEKIAGSDVTWSFDSINKTLTFGGKGDIPDYDTYEDESGKSTIPWFGCEYNKIVFGNEITGIGNYAFRKSAYLVEITIPETIKKIGVGAFSNCLELKTATIKKGITVISGNTFSRCSSLETIELPDGLTEIGTYAFYRCSSLKSVKLPDSVKTIATAAFNSCTALETFVAPKSLLSIGDRAFYCCEQLKSVNLPENMDYIGSSAFDSCSSLTEITLPAGIQKISDAAFSGCSLLGKVLIPEGIKTIEDNAFLLCASLKSVRIPYTVETIGEKAFGYGSRGKLIEGFTAIGFDSTAAQTYATDNKIAFESLGNPLAKSGKIGEKITWTIDEDSTLIFTGNGAIADYSVYDMPVYLNSEIKDVIIDDNITALGAYSLFGNCDIFLVPERITAMGRKALGYHFDENGKVIKNEDFIILGYKGTIAETYAKNNGFDFLAIVDEGLCGEKSTWDYDIASKTLTISGEGTVTSLFSDGTIPCFFAEEMPVEKVVVREGIKELAEDAFIDLDNGANKITFRLPKSLTKIGNHSIGFSQNTIINNDKEETVYTPNKSCIIEGYAATQAETYATGNGLEFIMLDPTVNPPATADTTFKLSTKATVCTFDEKTKTIKIFAQDATADKIMADFVIGKDLVVSEIKSIATGATIKTTYSASVSNTYTLALMGDVNGDGKINSSDALAVLQHSVAISSLTGAKLTAADLDANGNVNSADALKILRISVGLDKLSDFYPKAEDQSKVPSASQAK